MNITVFLITLYIFFESISYGIYEFQNKNKLGSIIIFILSIFMIIFVNISVYKFI